MKETKQSEDTCSLKKNHFNHDKSFYYNLKDINFDVFLTVHFRKKGLYSESLDSDCNRRKFFREIFGNLTTYLEIPRKSLFYFGIAEIDCDDKMHCHLLIKFRNDVFLSDQEKVKGINKIYLLAKDDLRITDTNKRGVEVVDDSQNAANYMLKIKTFDEKQTNLKENYYHSKNFDKICKYMNAGAW